MKTIAFMNIKGGVAKTASAVTVAHILSSKYKKRVLLVDADPQANATITYSQINLMDYLESYLFNKSLANETYTMEDILTDPKLDVHRAIFHTEYDNLDMIPALITLSECEERMKGDVSSIQQFKLKNQLRKVQDEYDYCVIDCSPSVNIINVNALATADEVYIPMKCDANSGIGMCLAKKLIDTVADFNERLHIGGCFFTQWEPKKRVSKTVAELLESVLGDELLPITIRKSKYIEEMSYCQKPLLAYDNGTTPSPVTQDYLDLTKYIITH